MKTTTKSQPIDLFHATMVCEGVEESSREHCIRCWQALIDSGIVWQLQGRFGRTAQRLIDEGICHAAAQMNAELEAGRATGHCLIVSIGHAETRIFIAYKIRCARRRQAAFELWYWLGAAIAVRRTLTR